MRTSAKRIGYPSRAPAIAYVATPDASLSAIAVIVAGPKIDKNTIKRSAQTILETLPVNTADIFSLNNRPIEIAREDNNEKMNAETIFYPYTDNGDGWKLEIKITSAKNLTHEIRSMRSKIGELLEALNHDK